MVINMVFYVKVIEALVKFKIKVRDKKTGDPIQDAKVTIYADGTFVGTKYTDSNGETDWFEVDMNAWVTGEVEKSGYVKSSISGFTATKDYDGQTITVYLTPEELKGDIKIIVYNWKGELEDANVYRKVDGKWGDFRTTKDGVVVYGDLPYGTYEFKVSDPIYGEKTFVVTLDEPLKEVTVTIGSPKARVKFYVYYMLAGKKEPLVGAEVHMWCDEIGYDKTLIVDSSGYADFGEVEPCHIYQYKVTKTGYVPYESQIHPAEGKSHEIEVKMITEEEAECPPLFRAVANLLGMSCDEARALVFGIAGLFVVAFILGVLL